MELLTEERDKKVAKTRVNLVPKDGNSIDLFCWVYYQVRLLHAQALRPTNRTVNMHLQALPTLLFSVLLLINSTNAAQAWVRFCDDDNCSENCGIWVSIDNPGCLTEPHRRSFYVDGTGINWDQFSLVISPVGDSYCSCQANCLSQWNINDPTNYINGAQNKCYKLDELQRGGSYRWIQGGCPLETNCGTYEMEQVLLSDGVGFPPPGKKEWNQAFDYYFNPWTGPPHTALVDSG